MESRLKQSLILIKRIAIRGHYLRLCVKEELQPRELPKSTHAFRRIKIETCDEGDLELIRMYIFYTHFLIYF